MLPSLVHKPTSLAGTWGAGRVLVTRVHTPSAVVSPPYTEGTRAEKICAQETMEKRRSPGKNTCSGLGGLHVWPEQRDVGLWEPGGDEQLPRNKTSRAQGALPGHFSPLLKVDSCLSFSQWTVGIKLCPSPSPPLTEWVTLLTPLHLIERQLAPW